MKIARKIALNTYLKTEKFAFASSAGISVAVLGVSLICAPSTWAQSSTTTKAADAYPDAAGESKSSQSAITGSTLGGLNKQFKADDEITDNKMKADAGSLSQFSAKFNLSYYGPPVGDLNNEYQPNIDGRVSNNQTAVSGNVGVQYRITPKDTILFGTGIKGNFPTEGFPDGFAANTPQLAYAHTARWNGIQIRQAPEIDQETLKTWTGVGEAWAAIYNISTVYDFNKSPYAVGLDGGLGYYFYNRGYIPPFRTATGWQRKSDGTYTNDGKDNQASVTLYPTFKYNFNSKTQFTTSLTIGWLNPRDVITNPSNDHYKLIPSTMKQSIGVSYSFTRDIYIYPNLGFYPTHLDWPNTTLNVSTVFSLL